MKRFLSLLSLTCLLGLGAYAQQVLKGMVQDSLTGAPVPGATIRVLNGTGGVTTNAKGEFELVVPGNAQLRITSLGFEPLVMPARLVTHPIRLKMTSVILNAPVVVGYGSQQRRNLTNSISTVNSSALAPEKNIVGDVGKALQGRVAGVFVANSSGTPGNNPTIQIRGVQSATPQFSNPLVVMDGLVLEGNTVNINSINPQDIESIEVLKDAASAAIYGARGSTGVIIITTKKGRRNAKPSFSVNFYTGVNNVPTSRRMLTTGEYSAAFKDSRNNRINDINNILANPGNLTPAQVNALQNERVRRQSEIDGLQMADRSTDWIDKIRNRNAPVSNIQASMSGGGEKNNYYMSLGRYAEQATFGTGQFERYTAKLDVTQQVNDWLKLSGNLNLTQSVNKNASYPLLTAFNARPDTPEEPVRDADGSLGYYVGRQEHPLGYMTETNNRNKASLYFGGISADLQLHRNLQFHSQFSATKNNTYNRDFQSPFGYLGAFNKGQLKTNGVDNFSYNFDNYFTYTNRWRKLGNTTTLGYTFYNNELNSFGYDLLGFPMVEGVSGGGSAAGYGNINSIGSYNTNNQEVSEAYFVRTGFDWDGRYMLNASLRLDGSSKLAKDHRYSWFPSVSAGWDLAREQFLDGASWVQQLKLRTSYGISGNIRPVGYFSTQHLILATNYLGEAALKLDDVIGNPGIRWERTRQVDAGLDASLFQGRLTMALDYYNKTTDGLISTDFVPWIFGAQSKPSNIGNIRNYGFDLELGLGSRPQSVIRWKVETNLNINRNRILALKDSVMTYGPLVFGGPASKVKVGQPVGSVQVYNALGVDPQTGDMIYEDVNKDGSIGTADLVTIPVALPKFTGGTSITLGYRAFTLDALFSYVAGSKIYDYYEQTLRNYELDFYGVMPNKFDVVNRRWRKPGDRAEVPRAITGAHGAGNTTDWNYRPSTQYIFNASYLRLRNLSLSYQVPAHIAARARINQARIYAAAQNVFTITDYIGFDPEAAASTGIVSTNLPNPRSLVIGIDLSF